MENFTIEEEIEKYPYLKKFAEYTLFISKEDFEKIKNGEKIKIDNTEIPIEFLKRILNNSSYYEYAKKFFTNKTNIFNVTYIINGDIGNSISYTKSTIIKGITQLILKEKITLQPDEQQRYNTLKDSISFKKFLEKYKDDGYNINIEGKKYSIPIIQLIALMQLSDEKLNRLCSNREIKNINGMPKEYFIYAAIKFIKDSKIIDEFLIPENIINHYTEIYSLQKIDLEAINQHLKTEDTIYKNVIINKELEEAILAGMPKNSTDLEKAIYIYIKMCKILTYDEEYYAVSQIGIATEKHKHLNHVSTITLDNNKVVCFEFNLIYSKFLNDLGIKFKSYYKNMSGEAYGKAHANLEFRTNKYLVSADSVTSILQGDIIRAKLNQPLIGLKCINKNINTQQEFKEALTKMYQLIAQQENKTNDNQVVEHIQTLEELLEEYSNVTSNIKEIGLSEKLSILIDKVNSTKMIGIDSLSYVLQLRKILFTEEERKNNIVINIIRNNQPFDENKIAMASAIFTINNQSFEDNPEQNIYYYFNPNNELIPITKEELQEKFNNGLFDYIENDNPKIPGIIENGGIKK